ncbi:2-amino-4-hydroxy-6-hydroxymethyldihydropteridine diphosphokinase [Persephonella sp. KM09-Lau-8]|uniref:2-amino-4-hydroxy-6- hydroxymethyldihydropteridine diphosphokinase n=1 Tax=Persephonella sp. KM09-Lau-8 TaxID=1158345 RepID=UPI000496BD6D|nr:2-amino-4-hydroxy-6-hydroxymethyldihydropteridine diphosphokinase [Persephonella sp. KM09-Lau-8]
MEKIFLALGSNIGNRQENINQAIKFLSTKILDIKQATIYESKAIGYENQPDFLNTAISGYTDLSPEELLKFIKQVEEQTGRIKRFRWGPREIDIDILFYGNLVLEKENLIIPHPRIHERDFVLKPLCDLEPEFIHPVLKKTIKELLNNLQEKSIIGKITKSNY